jgi:hypothetical protein
MESGITLIVPLPVAVVSIVIVFAVAFRLPLRPLPRPVLPKEDIGSY